MSDRPEVQAELEARLKNVGFDFGKPNVQLSWHVFKAFVWHVLPTHQIDSVAFDVLHFCDRDEELWLGLELGLGNTGASCCFTHLVPTPLRCVHHRVGFSASDSFSITRSEIASFVQEVEACNEFKVAVELPDWKWEGQC